MSSPPEQSSRSSDGLVPDDAQKLGVEVESGEASLKLFAEDLVVRKEIVETGRLQVRKETHTREADVDAELLREDAVVETVPKGHRIYTMPTSRVVGDTTIIPVVEEVIFTEKRLFLKEEIHVTRRRTTQHFHDTVTLRHQEAVVSRIQSATDELGIEPGHKLEKPQE
jgi:uncharacterized protein (TIGR02271 family)